MAVVQTITLTKSGSSFADVDEARADIRATMNDAAYLAEMNDLVTANSMSRTETFDTGTQTYTLVRTWDDSAYATWNSGKASEVSAHKASLEAAGYTTDSQIA